MGKIIDLNYVCIEFSKTCGTVAAERSYTSLVALKIPITYG